MERQTEVISAEDVGTLEIAEVAPAPGTHAARLQALLIKALPSQEQAIRTGQWGPLGAPYQFDTPEPGLMRLLIEDRRTGDRIGVVGTTRAELLDQLEARLSR